MYMCCLMLACPCISVSSQWTAVDCNMVISLSVVSVLVPQELKGRGLKKVATSTDRWSAWELLFLHLVSVCMQNDQDVHVHVCALVNH